ncbi:MAG: hypothetical protein IH596_11770 [Bacteroidales bacterium]|nr:hypothetical protein [Bacteroidales bacterium]
MTAIDPHLLEDYFKNVSDDGLENFNLKVGGIGLSVNATKDELFETALTKYEEFLVPEAFPESVVFYDVQTLPDPDAIIQAFDQYKEIYTSSAGRFLNVYRWDFFGIIDIENRTGKFILFNTTFMTYESIIRIFYSLLAVENHGFLIHSSSLVHKDKGYVFFGISGSGKSTVVKLSESDECLTDELTMITKTEDGYFTSGTPFHGELPIYKNKTAPLANLFLLTKSETTYFEKLKQSDIYPILLRNVLFFSDDWELRQKIFNTVIDLAKHVDIYEMYFEKNNKFWRIIDNGFKNED